MNSRTTIRLGLLYRGRLTALDWLNEMTVDSVSFFGLEVELWRIGDSPAAPRFNIVCQPNDWQNNVRNAAAAIVSDEDRPRHILRVKYWTALRAHLQENQSKLRAQKPSRDHWYNFGIGTSLAHVAALLISRDNRIGVSLYLTSPEAKEIFSDLAGRKDEFEKIIGAELDWRPMFDNKVSRLVLSKDVKSLDESEWSQQFVWLQETLEKFDSAFRPYFQQRKAAA